MVEVSIILIITLIILFLFGPIILILMINGKNIKFHGNNILNIENYSRSKKIIISIIPLLISTICLGFICRFIFQPDIKLSNEKTSTNNYQSEIEPSVGKIDKGIVETPFIKITEPNPNINLFIEDCLTSNKWVVYGGGYTEDTNGCLQIPGLLAIDNGISFFVDVNNNYGSHGISTSIKQETIIMFKIKVEDLHKSPLEKFSRLSFGFIPKDTPTPYAGMLYFLQVDELNQNNIKLRYRRPGWNNTESLSKRIGFRTEYEIKIQVNGLNSSLFIDNEKISESISLPSKESLFWIGYEIPENGKLDASISDFEIKNK